MVILVFPAFNILGFRMEHPPLGVMTIAAALVAKDIPVTILDENVEPDFDRRLIALLQEDPVAVGISSMSGRQITAALRVSALVRRHADVPIIWGGVQASLEPETTLAHELVDMVIRNDGEEAFPALIQALMSGATDVGRIQGIGYKKNGRPVMTEDAPPADILKLPPMPFELIDYRRYRIEPGSRADDWTGDPKYILPMETSRGCPFSCIFCTESVRKKKWRALPPDTVIRHIRHYIMTTGIRNFQFIDDNLFGNIRRGKELIARLAEENLGIRWYSNIRTDFIARVEPSFIRLMEQSGCRLLTFGAESGSERLLAMINKKAHPEDVLAANRRLLGSAIRPHFVTIRGFPTETRGDLIKTLQLLVDIVLENPRAVCDSPCLIATPSTRIADMCLGDTVDGYVLEDWADILDRFKDERPPWVDPDTYRAIRRHRLLPYLVANANRRRGNAQHLMRLALRTYRMLLRYDHRF